MKIRTIIFLGFILLLLLLLVKANSIEDGDPNAISMYLVVFFVPCLIISILNGTYLLMIARMQNKVAKTFLCFVPVLGLALLSSIDYLKIGAVDGNLAGVALIGAITFAITNTMWLIDLWKGRSKSID